jgi:hypothetical protein
VAGRIGGKVQPEEPIDPHAFTAPVMRKIIGRGEDPMPILCRLCRWLGKEACPHRVEPESKPPEIARLCDIFLVNASTNQEFERLVFPELSVDSHSVA